MFPTMLKYVAFALTTDLLILFPGIFILSHLSKFNLRLFTVSRNGQSKQENALNINGWGEGLLAIKNTFIPRKPGDNVPESTKVIVDGCGIQLSIFHYIYYFAYTMMLANEILLVTALVLFFGMNGLANPFTEPRLAACGIAFCILAMLSLLSGSEVKSLQGVMMIQQAFMVSASFFCEHNDKENYVDDVQFMNAVRAMLTPSELKAVIDESSHPDEENHPVIDADVLMANFLKALDEKQPNGASWIHQLTDSGISAYRRIKDCLDAKNPTT